MTQQTTVEPSARDTHDVAHAGQSAEHKAEALVARAKPRMVTLWHDAEHTLHRPAVGAAVAGGAVLAAGAFVGVTEAVIAGAAAWAVFRTLSKRAPARTETQAT